MTRIADYAANNTLTSYILQTQKRLHDLQIQVSTGKVSQDYQGLAREAQRLVNFENTRSVLDRYVTGNDLKDVRLKTTESVMDAIKKAVTDFRELLFEYESGDLSDEQRVRDIQDAAYRGMVNISAYLNSEVDGRYIFAGGRVTTEPVNLNLTSLSDFQAKYDGASVVYPPTRNAHVETKLSLDSTATGGLTLSNGPPATLTAGTAGSLASIPVGATITLGGAPTAGNNTNYTVVSNNGTDIEISGNFTIGASTIAVTNSFASAEAAPAATLSVDTYYDGDTATQTHRVDASRDFGLDLNAIDPAFEKALRAMSIIAQGSYGTAGGLDSHPERIDQALYLINYSLDNTDPGSPPFGVEQTSSIRQIERDVGYQRVLIDETNQQQEALISFYEQRIADTENIVEVEAITRLLDDSQALEASYQAMSRIRQLSLSNYL